MSLELAREHVKAVLTAAQAADTQRCTVETRLLQRVFHETNVWRALVQQQADELAELRRKITELEFSALNPARSPTHRCRVCGAFWIQYQDSWSLCSMRCGKCCDNEAAAPLQMEALCHSDLLKPVESPDVDEESASTRTTAAKLRTQLQNMVDATSLYMVCAQLDLLNTQPLKAFLSGEVDEPGPVLRKALALDVEYIQSPRRNWSKMP